MINRHKSFLIYYRKDFEQNCCVSSGSTPFVLLTLNFIIIAKMFLKIENLLVASLDNVIFHLANNKGTDQSVWMRRMFCPCIVRKPQKTGFLVSRPICCGLNFLNPTFRFVHNVCYQTRKI